MIRVVIAEDNAGLRAGIRGILKLESDIQVVGEAADGREAVWVAREARPDVLLLDFQMPKLRGDEVLRELCPAVCEVKVLVLSSFDDQEFVKRMMDCGAHGYLTKDEAIELLADAIRKIGAGEEKWLSPKAAFSTRLFRVQEAPIREMVSRKEVRALQLLSAGKEEAEIARRMRLEAEAWDQFLGILMAKFGVQARGQLRLVVERLFGK